MREDLDDRWDRYLTTFHSDRAGVTDVVLGRTRASDGVDPYAWLARALPGGGVVLDVGCGNGPLAPRVGAGWVGLDRNRSELGAAPAQAAGRLIQADAASVAVGASRADAVVCSMALMLFGTPAAVVTEMTRVLRPGGLLVALVPARAPLTARDRVRYARLLVALRLRRLPFRHQAVLDEPLQLLAPAGLQLVGDERRRFVYPLTTTDDSLRLIRSLYLPDVPAGRMRAAQQVARRWVGSGIGIPLRRLVAVRPR